MSDTTGIQWCDSIWSPVTGCDKVSPGCAHCYALTLAKRLKAMGNPKYQQDGANPLTSGPGFGVTLHHDALTLPLRWKKPRRIFVNSMSDLFHDEVPDSFILRVWETMAKTPRHTYMILTKRPERMAAFIARLSHEDWRFFLDYPMGFTAPLPNVWLGVSVESQRWADERIPLLAQCPAAVRFVSAEPLLGPVDLRPWLTSQNSSGNFFGYLVKQRPALHWVICGGESGPKARPLDIAWARDIVTQCKEAGVAVFYKQGGSSNRCPHDAKGGHFDCFPTDLQVQEMPNAI